EGLGRACFYAWRFNEDGNERTDNPLREHDTSRQRILVTGENFGCGSSREHAPWAIADFGIKCIVSTSFADIFFNNCFKNGILPIKLPQEDIDKLMDDAERGANAVISVDLEAQEIRGPDGGVIRFDIDPFRKKCLLEGLDDIGLTLQKGSAIEAYEGIAGAERPWL
ncbi:MAG: 3-isopropylmalate dehydratase small subunit, partial [Methyloligellaceae bacterium]